MLRLLTPILLAGLTVAQGTTFRPNRPMFYLAVDDLPGLLAAAERGAIGRMFADAEIAEALELGKKSYLERAAKWVELVRALQAASPTAVTFGERAELALREIDWRDAHSFELSAAFADDGPGVDVAAGNPAVVFRQPATTLVVHPVGGARPRVKQTFDAFVADLRLHAPLGLEAADEQKIDGQPALVFETGAVIEQLADGFVALEHQPIWLTSGPGMFVGGAGTPDVGTFSAREARPPGVRLGVDLARYIQMIAAITTGSNEAEKFLEAIGIANARVFEWKLSCTGDRLQDDMSLEFDGPIEGLLGSFLTGMAPLPDQPLPKDGLLQVRCTFDIGALVASTDKLLELNHLKTLSEQNMLDDLRRAWTGGAAFGAARPAPGGLVPRIYASFGIVDDEALDRLLAMLHAQPWIEVKPRKIGETPVTVLGIDGMPPAIQPAYCRIDGTVHFAETFQSLRALLRAQADGAPRALDVGDAPRPKGSGTLMPNFELRYDGRALHHALHEVWMPYMTTLIAARSGETWLSMRDMPDAEVVAEHLGTGRGVLRRTKDGVALSMSGTLGGPETQTLAVMFGPFLSAGLSQEWNWSYDSARVRLLNMQMRKTLAAIDAFEKKEGKRPASLGVLIAGGHLEATTLKLVGDDKAEPVMHDGKNVAEASFRYYPEGLKVSPSGNEITATLIAISQHSYWRTAMDAQGQIHQGWGDFAEQSLDEVEKAARKK